MHELWIDLHVHTVLSACAEVEMIPPLIVREALALGLNWIAIADHNAAYNVAAVIKAAEGTPLTVSPGIEVQSREEVHLLCLFDTLEQVHTWQERVFAALPPLENDEELFGPQFIVDATGEYVRTEERLLSTSTTFSVEEIVSHVQALGGIVLPAHVDRPSFSLFANLGFVPPGLEIAGLELSRHADPAEILRRFPQAKEWGLLVSGDAHRLNELTRRTHVWVEEPTVSELALALAGLHGRRVEIIPIQEEAYGRTTRPGPAL